jgi:hypothetical protein
MTFTVTPADIYFALCGLLLVLQVVQYYMLQKTKTEINLLWAQIGILASTVAAKLEELNKKVDNDKK